MLLIKIALKQESTMNTDHNQCSYPVDNF